MAPKSFNLSRYLIRQLGRTFAPKFLYKIIKRDKQSDPTAWQLRNILHLLIPSTIVLNTTGDRMGQKSVLLRVHVWSIPPELVEALATLVGYRNVALPNDTRAALGRNSIRLVIMN